MKFLLVLLLFCLPVVSAVSDSDLAPFISNYWHFDGSLVDSVGGINFEPIGSISYVGGKVGNAVNFTAGTSYLQNLTAGLRYNVTGLSFGCWVNFSSGGTHPTFVGGIDSCGGSYRCAGVEGRFTSGADYRFSVDGYNVATDAGGAVARFWKFYGGFYNFTHICTFIDNVTGTCAFVNAPLNQSVDNKIVFGARAYDLYNSITQFYGSLDECIIFNKSLSSAEINYVYQKGLSGQNISLSGGASNSLTIVPISLPDGFHINNQTPQFSFNVTSIVGVWNVSLVVNGSSKTTLTGISAVGVYNMSFGVGFSLLNGLYTWYFNGTDGSLNSNTSVRNLTYDDVNPILVWSNPDSANTSVSRLNLSLSVQGSDANLWAYQFNVSNSTHNVCSGSKFNISSSPYVLGDQCNLSVSGKYIVDACFADSHTITSFPNATSISKAILPKDLAIVNYEVKDASLDVLYYSFGSDMIGVVAYSGDKDLVVSSLGTVKSVDRYSFVVNLVQNKPKVDYNFSVLVSSSLPIYRVYGSPFKGHYVVGGRYWIDFDGDNSSLLREDFVNGTVVLTFRSSATQVKFNSLGGLNEICESHSYFFDISPPSSTGFVNTGGRFADTVTWNITLSDNYGIGWYQFVTNMSGSWVANSKVSGNNSFVQVSKTVTQFGGTNVCGYFNFSDVAGNNVTTAYSCFIVGDNVLFNSQNPADITNTNLLNTSLSAGLNLSFNVSIVGLNRSTPAVWFTINSSLRSCIEYFNGTCVVPIMYWTPSYALFNVSNVWYFRLSENDVYPGSYPLNDSKLYNPMFINALTNPNRYAYFEEYAMLNNTDTNFLEVSVNVTSGVCNIYLSNISGRFSTLPTNASVLVGSVSSTVHSPYYHCHYVSGATYCDEAWSYTISNGRINGVSKVVNTTMYVYVIPQSVGTTCNLITVNYSERNNAFQATTNNGVSFTAQANTVRSHIHQFDSSNLATFLYYGQAVNNTGYMWNSTVRSDNLDVTATLTNPVILTPVFNASLNALYKVNISWSPAVGINTSVSFYNISLLNNDTSFNRSIQSNNSLNTSFMWNLTGVADGEYFIRVVAYDNSTPALTRTVRQLVVVNNNCVVPIDDLNVYTSITLCTGTYSINDGGSLLGILYLNSSNLIINGNGSTIIGNGSGRVITKNSGKSNETIYGFIFDNYSNTIDAMGNNENIYNNIFYRGVGVGVQLSGVTGANIYNNIFENMTSTIIFSNNGGNYNIYNNTAIRYTYYVDSGYFLNPSVTADDVGNVSVYNNVMIRTNLIKITGIVNKQGNYSIYNNVMQDYANYSSNTGGIVVRLSRNNSYPILIYNNTFNNGHSPILVEGSGGVSIYNNRQYNLTKISLASAFIGVYDYAKNVSNNVSIYNNTINITDTGIYIKNSTNINIYNNVIDNTYTYTDAWGTGIRLESNSINISIYGNNITNSAGAGIMLRKTNNVTIYNNYIDQLNISSRNALASYLVEPAYASGIALVELYLGYIGDSSELTTDNITKVSQYKNTNINIFNNSFGPNLQIKLTSQGTVNLSHDISSYWLREINYDTALMDNFKYYFSNSVTKFQCENSNYPLKPGVTIQDNCQYSYPWSSGVNTFINYSISQSLINFTDINNARNETVGIFSASSWSPYNDVYNVSGGYVLSFDVDNYSIKLYPNDRVSVGDFGSAPAPVFFSPIGGGGGGSPVSLNVLCPGNLSWNGSVCVDLGLPMSFARIDTDLVDSTVYLSLNSRKSFSFFFYRDGVLSDVSVFGAQIFWNGSARPVYISRSGVGSYLFDYDFAGLSGKVTVSVVMDGVVRSVDLFVDDSTVAVAKVKSVFTGLSVLDDRPFASKLFFYIIIGLIVGGSLLWYFTSRGGKREKGVAR